MSAGTNLSSFSASYLEGFLGWKYPAMIVPAITPIFPAASEASWRMSLAWSISGFRSIHLSAAAIMSGSSVFQALFTWYPLKVSLTLWQEIPADRVPALDQGKENFYSRPGRESECLASLFHPDLAES